jgi:hypothetical protein
MKMRTIVSFGLAAALALLTLSGATRVTAQQIPAAPLAASTVPAAQLVQPQELSRMLNAQGAGRPLILQVGSRVMFDQARIPGSEYAGPGSRDEGLTLLKERVKALPKAGFVVLYCGCCPWGRCPNVGNAYKTLHDLGFTNVKVLYIADNFGADWVSKGYPVAH